METPGPAKRCGWTAFQRPGVWENPARIPGNKIYSRIYQPFLKNVSILAMCLISMAELFLESKWTWARMMDVAQAWFSTGVEGWKQHWHGQKEEFF